MNEDGKIDEDDRTWIGSPHPDFMYGLNIELSPTNPDSNIPAITALNANDEGRMSTYFVENGSFLKLRNLQLGYTLPRKISEKAYIEKCRIYVSGQNLFTIKSKNFSGVDPENAGFGYPIPTTFTVGINIGF